MGRKPTRKPTIRVPQDKILTYQLQPMPSDATIGNHITAGWLMSEMDKASGLRAHDYIYAGDRKNGGRTVTVGIDAMNFKKPVYVGDLVKIYTEIVRQGRTSLTLKTESWAERRNQILEKVTEGLFTFVAIDKNRKPVEILTNNAANPVLVAPGTSRKNSPATTTISSTATPAGQMVLKISTDKTHTNHMGDIFGGWLLSRMDDAGSAMASRLTGYKVANVALEAMTFYKPVFVHDEVSFYAQHVKTGTTSISINIETWATRHNGNVHEKVTEGLFTYVAVDRNFKPVAFSAGP